MKDQPKDMVGNNNLKRKVNILIHEYGVKQSFICEKIDEHKGFFNGWVQIITTACCINYMNL